MRHSSKTILLARELHAEGLNASKVTAELQRRGISVALTTVMSWIDDEFRERRNMDNPRRGRREKQRRKRLAVDTAMLELRAAGLPYSAIAVVISRYHGVKMCESTARRRCRELGVEANPKKVELAYRAFQGVKEAA